MKSKRGYSNEFPTGLRNGRKIGIDDVPAGLLRAARARARREGVSLRVQILRMLSAWVRS
jgi:hypothetical protein